MILTIITAYRGETRIDQTLADDLHDAMEQWVEHLDEDLTVDERVRMEESIREMVPTLDPRHVNVWSFDVPVGSRGEPARVTLVKTAEN